MPIASGEPIAEYIFLMIFIFNLCAITTLQSPLSTLRVSQAVITYFIVLYKRILSLLLFHCRGNSSDIIMRCYTFGAVSLAEQSPLRDTSIAD